MKRENILRRRIRWLTWFFIFGLFISGATAIPLLPELNWLANIFDGERSSLIAQWLSQVCDALQQTHSQFPFFFTARTGWRSGTS